MDHMIPARVRKVCIGPVDLLWRVALSPNNHREPGSQHYDVSIIHPERVRVARALVWVKWGGIINGAGYLGGSAQLCLQYPLGVGLDSRRYLSRIFS